MKTFSKLHEAYFNPNTIISHLIAIKTKFLNIENSIKRKNIKDAGALDIKDLMKKVNKTNKKVDGMLSKIGSSNKYVAKEDSADAVDNSLLVNVIDVLNKLKEVRLHMIAAQRVKPNPVSKINKLKIDRGGILDIENLESQWRWVIKDISEKDKGTRVQRIVRKMRYIL